MYRNERPSSLVCRVGAVRNMRIQRAPGAVAFTKSCCGMYRLVNFFHMMRAQHERFEKLVRYQSILTGDDSCAR